jgi:hypothetical protein
MNARILAPLLAAGMMISSAASAGIPYIQQCQLYGDDLRYAVSEIHFHGGQPEFVTQAQQKARTLCLMGNAQEGVEVLKAAINQLGIPLRDRGN